MWKTSPSVAQYLYSDGSSNGSHVTREVWHFPKEREDLKAK